MAVLGFETSSGDFEVVDLCFAGLPDVYIPQAGGSSTEKGKGKAKNGDMEVEREFSEDVIWYNADAYLRKWRNHEDMGRNGLWTLHGCSRGTSRCQSRDADRVVDRRSGRYRGESH